jgi:preprotein translocase subunit YajC
MNTFLLFFQGGLGALGQFLPVILIIGVFYVLLIRPQQKRQRELQETISNLKVGDRIVTSGGIKGRITTVRDSSFVIISAEKSTLEVSKGSIAGIDSEQEKPG